MKGITSAIILSAMSSFVLANEIRQVHHSDTQDTVRIVITGDPGIADSQAIDPLEVQRHRPDGLTILEVRADEAEAIILYLKQQPGVQNAERDLMTSTPSPVSARSLGLEDQVISQASGTLIGGSQPNDPEYATQYSWHAPTDLYPGQHNILEGVGLSSQKERLRIGMTDSGFYDREDVVYAGGYSFTTVFGAEPSTIFYEDYHNPTCDNPHGGSVAHIIGAKTDNGIGVAGAVDADLYAARVMDCGTGLLSEMSTGIRWLARDTSLSSSVPVIDQPVDIINISMGAKSDTCPSYVQNAIDLAYSRGIAIFVAAGNDAIPAKDYTPANCKNVVTVGSVNRSGTQSSFSNHGSAVDLSALGEMVKSEGTEGYSYWFGTSFSAPNAAGMAALVKQANPTMSPERLYSYMKTTTRPYAVGAAPDGLGTGIMDAKRLMEAVNADAGLNAPVLRPALASPERCNEAAYSAAVFINDDGGAVQPCAIFEVDVSTQEAPAGYGNRSLYRVPQGGNLTVASAELVKAAPEEKFVIYNLDPATYDYGFAFCNADGTACEQSELVPLNDDAIDPNTYCR